MNIRALCTMAVLAVVGCHDPTSSTVPSLAGNWTGTGDNNGITMTALLKDTSVTSGPLLDTLAGRDLHYVSAAFGAGTVTYNGSAADVTCLMTLARTNTRADAMLLMCDLKYQLTASQTFDSPEPSLDAWQGTISRFSSENSGTLINQLPYKGLLMQRAR